MKKLFLPRLKSTTSRLLGHTLLACASLAAPALAATTPNESLVQVTYYVDDSAMASDSGSCTSSSAPCRTVKSAFEKSRDDNLHSKIYIYDGTYIEASRVDHGFGEDMTKVLVVEGQSKAGVRITYTGTYGGYIYFAPNKGNVVFRKLTFDGCRKGVVNFGQWEPISSSRYLLIEDCDFFK
jgi:hypothetical protein